MSKKKVEIEDILSGELLTEEYLDDCKECKQLPLLRRMARTLLTILKNQDKMKTMIMEHNRRLKQGQTRFDEIKEFQIEKKAENGTIQQRVEQMEKILEKIGEWKGETDKILSRLSIAFIALGIMGTALIAIVGYVLVLHLK